MAPQELQDHINALVIVLHSNISAVYAHKGFYPSPSDKVIDLTEHELKIQFQVKTILEMLCAFF
jgi:hypothetical protein